MRPSMPVLAREHMALRGVARVLKMDALVIERGGSIDIDVLHAIVTYIQAFPDQMHHPKEEDYVFAAMRKRNPEPIPVLDRLLQEHTREDELIREFAEQLHAYETDPETQAAAFVRVAKNYVAFLENHMTLENADAFPLAETLLTEQDWAEIDAAFAKNDDPIFGQETVARFEALRKRIMDLGLPPFGLGQRGDKSQGAT